MTPTAPTRTPRPALILISLLIAAFAINLDTTIVNVALPTLERQMHATNTQLQWIVDAYNLVFAALILASGSASDRLGRKGMLLGGLGVFGTASVIGGFTGSPGQLIVVRCVMGLGAAMVFPATLSLISNVFTERGARARAIGLWGATGGAAIALGPIVGGWLIEQSSWSAIFFAMGPVAALGALLVARNVPTSRDESAPRTDWPGLVLSTATMALLVFTIIEAPEQGWSSAATLGGFAGAVALLGAFIATERRTDAPMLDVSLFADLRFSAASAAVTVSFFSLFGFIFLMTQYFQFFKLYSPLSAGVHLLPVASSVAVASVLGTKLAVRFGTKMVVVLGLALVVSFYVWVGSVVSAGVHLLPVATSVAVASVLGTKLAVRFGTKIVVVLGLALVVGFYLWVGSVVSAGTGYATIAAQMVIYGTGMGLTSAPATEAIMGVVPRARAGVGSAVNDATRLLGGTLGVAIIGSVFASLYSHRLGQTLPAGLPAPLAHAAHSSVGAALSVAAHLGAGGHATLAGAVHSAAAGAFMHGLSAGCMVAAGVSAAGAVMAALLLPAQPTNALEPTRRTLTALHAAGSD